MSFSSNFSAHLVTGAVTILCIESLNSAELIIDLMKANFDIVFDYLLNSLHQNDEKQVS